MAFVFLRCFIVSLRGCPVSIAFLEWYAARHAEMDRYLGVTEEDISNAGTAGIETDQSGMKTIYNLQGLPVRNPKEPGIYIVDGKKVFL